MKNLVRGITFLILLIAAGCGVEREAEFENLEENLKNYNDLRIHIESKVEGTLVGRYPTKTSLFKLY